MHKIIPLIFFAATAFAAPTANEDFVVSEAANAYTNAVRTAATNTAAATNAVGTVLRGEIAAASAAAGAALDAASTALRGEISSVAAAAAVKTSTNDVCAIVTNVVRRYTQWECSKAGVTVTGARWEAPIEWLIDIEYNGRRGTVGAEGTFDATTVTGGSEIIMEVATFTRELVSRNALGLARMEDLESTAAGLLPASATNGLLAASATNLFLTAAATNGVAYKTDIPDPIGPAEIAAVVTNTVTGWTEWVPSVEGIRIEEIFYNDPAWWVRFSYGEDGDWAYPPGTLDSTVLECVSPVVNFTLTRARETHNALNLARLEDLRGVESNGVTKAQLDKALAPVVADSWIRPGDWAAVASIVSDPVSVTDISFVTNRFTGCVTSNSVYTESWSLSADLSVETLDELAEHFSPGTVTYVPISGGTVMGTRFTATTAGVYRVRADSSKLGSRYCDVPLMQWQSTTSNSAVYVADAALDGLWRKDVNDTSLAVLNAATSGGTGTADGKEYNVWWTVRCPARPISGHTVQGYRSRNALTPHLMVGARHYAAGATPVEIDGVPVRVDWNASWLTMYDPVGQTNVAVSTLGGCTGDTAYDIVPIMQGYGFPLAMWAMTNGFTKAELAEMNIEDIMVYPVTGTIPDACCPYFMGPAAWEEHFGGGRVMGWAFTQTYVGRTGPDGIAAGNYMTPCVLSADNGAASWSCAAYVGSGSIRREVRADILARLDAMQAFPPIYGGDSSGGVYILHDSKWIMASQFKTVSSGPSFSKAVPVLRKLAAHYGDVLKEVE